LGRLRRLSGREVCRILEQHGFSRIRQRGSHAIMQKLIPGSTITVPVPLHDELKIGTLNNVIRQSRLPRTLFEAWGSRHLESGLPHAALPSSGGFTLRRASSYALSRERCDSRCRRSRVQCESTLFW
jgi:predicted RNA binding protein YcfA (HicA-like mRNA interferase family)